MATVNTMFIPEVNTVFIAGDTNVADHKQMVDKNEFDARWAAAMQAMSKLDCPIRNRAELAARLGMSSQRLNNWVNRSKRISSDARLEFEAATGVSVDWINDGIGEMHTPAWRVAESRPDYLRGLELWNEKSELPEEKYVALDALEYHLSAGPGGFDPAAAELKPSGAAFRADFAANQGWKRSTHFSMRAKGDSMEPTIQDGAPVIIATNETQIRSGKIYAILIDNEPLLKRLDKLPGGLVRVRSDNALNPAYAPFDVQEGMIEVIGRAVWTPVML
ncbi:hypothetical protein A7D35_02805 [Xanthomonas arboricola]|uniref:LexA family transcriptional regulator n=1 Tax=Xanthomonas arboricola TaxID=56448 RepID=UPI0007ECB848|nr:LexA family transcriptional regulator [Xanthomonas arboricola]OBR78760.1 hypothetical protein A7D35_02805 [Xanthomonas arboricola]